MKKVEIEGKKEKSQEIAVAKQDDTAITTAGMDFSDRFRGLSESDLVTPKAHLYQGLPREKKLYGNFSPGDIIDSLHMTKIEPPEFMPIMVYKEWVRWDETGQGRILYIQSDVSKVPPEDLEYVDGKPPRATEYHNWIVLFVNRDFPSLLRLKKSSLKTSKQLYTSEKLLGRRGPGLYVFSSKEAVSEKGEYLLPVFTFKSRAPEDMIKLGLEFYKSIRPETIRSKESDYIESETASEEVPF
ncbi:MAG: hypothetical protein KatS3mg104_3037 [Phycisphaerae bacterium]|nr:MAG: hypothetical protein KatS3mg104_3037 [Phycisphaerae bacterium]